MLHDTASGERIFEENTVESRVFAIMRDTSEHIAKIADEKTRVNFESKSAELDAQMKADLQDHEAHLGLEDYTPTDLVAKNVHRSSFIAFRQDKWADNRIEFVQEQADLELKELLDGRTVTIQALSGKSPQDVFEQHENEVLSGRVVAVSALLGTLTVRSANDQTDVVARLFETTEDFDVEQQALLRIID